jgi:carbon monoxide dehydrogenase subunit G
MGVKIEKSFQVQYPADVVWSFLSDPKKVVTCVPGAKIVEQIDDRNYKGAISVKVGPSITDFKGEVQIQRLDAEAHEIEILGKGNDTRGRGSASMKLTGRLRATDDKGTEVVALAELNVAGILAQMGGRVMQEVSNIMFEQFTKNFREKLASGEMAAASGEIKPISAVGLAFSAIKATVTGKPAGSDAKPESGPPAKESGGRA